MAQILLVWCIGTLRILLLLGCTSFLPDRLHRLCKPPTRTRRGRLVLKHSEDVSVCAKCDCARSAYMSALTRALPMSAQLRAISILRAWRLDWKISPAPASWYRGSSVQISRCKQDASDRQLTREHVGELLQIIAQELSTLDCQRRFARSARTHEKRLDVLSCYGQQIIIPVVLPVRMRTYTN